MKKLFLVFILFAVGCTKKNLPSEEANKPGDTETVVSPVPDKSIKDRYSMSGSNVSTSTGNSSIGGTFSETTIVVTDTPSTDDAGKIPGAITTEVQTLIDDNLSSVLEQEEIFNFCTFPDSLKIAVQKTINKDDCSLVTEKDLSQIKQLTIKNIREEETALLDEKYASYFPVLEDLDISNNLHMSELPEFVTSLSLLKKLDVSSTEIGTFNKKICHLKNLTSLIASHNNYEGQEVPFNIFCLKKLKVLNMSYSSIRYIDEYIYKLENLEELYMRGNDLMTVPFMLHTMPNILLVDLARNIFKPPSTLLSWLGYDSLNTLYDCKQYDNPEDRQECREEMIDNLQCEWTQKLPFERGEPFRHYKKTEDMGEVEQTTFEETKHNFNLNRCYNFWFANTFLALLDSEQELFRKKSINGKTIREWKVVFSARMEYSWWKRWSLCEQRIVWSDTSHLPKSQEILPHTSPSPDWLKDAFLLSWLFYEPPYSHSTNWEEVPEECIDKIEENALEEGREQ